MYTERCAKLLNYPFTGLNSLLSTVLNITIDKGEQRSNWYKRPLSYKQLQYAQNDVLHLLTLKHKLEHEVEKKGIGHWVKVRLVYMHVYTNIYMIVLLKYISNTLLLLCAIPTLYTPYYAYTILYTNMIHTTRTLYLYYTLHIYSIIHKPYTYTMHIG